LGTLTDNGGPVLTHALLPGSPAIDAGPAIHSTVSTDGRGQSRPVARRSPDTPGDLGAFELQVDEHYAPVAIPSATMGPPPATPTEAPAALIRDASGEWTLAALGLLGLLLLGLAGLVVLWRRRSGP
jgi:hypothetical protein